MSESTYVELAFWSGFVQAVQAGRDTSHGELCEMMERLRPVIADMVATYLSESEV